ncbi:MAG: CBS domain-containing protein [Candidatus Rokubacteria bacterium]|nr:CBS domain-containing protein [Candidatus Rokubacteria bacterium]
MRAGELMTSNPATLTPEATVAEAWDLMRELDIRHIPVVERGTLVGILSDRDLTDLDVLGMLAAEGAEAVRRETVRPVVEIMSSDVVSAEVDAELSEVVDLLLEHKIGAIPVIRADDRAVVGIISYVDVLRVLRDLLEER